MNSILDTISGLVEGVISKQETLDNALFVMQTWVGRNAPLLSEVERSEFSQTIAQEKSAPARDGVPFGSDESLVASILRLHTMRLLYRFDYDHQTTTDTPADDSTYSLGTRRLRDALRQNELSINEARVDAAVANAHQIMGDAGSNRRWLQDALARLQAAAKVDLIRLADSIPPPPLPELNLIQKATFFVFGIKPAEIARRNLKSLRQLAELQTAQIVEMAQLLVTSFEASGDEAGVSQSAALIKKLTPTPQI